MRSLQSWSKHRNRVVAAGNNISLLESTLIAMGISPDLPVVSNEDLAPPQLTSLTISPAAVDTSSSFQFATITAGVVHAVSGVNQSINVFDFGVVAGVQDPTGVKFTRGGLLNLKPNQ